MILSKIISTAIKKGRLIIKILGHGNSDIKTAYNLLPFGTDSRATKGYRCIYSDTGINGEKILLGVICQNILTEIGETRIFSEDVNGNEVFSIHLKNDGTCEIGGNSNFAVKYNELKQEYDKTKEVIEAIDSTLKNWTPVASDGGAALKTAYGIAISGKSIGDISSSKNDKILTI